MNQKLCNAAIWDQMEKVRPLRTRLLMSVDIQWRCETDMPTDYRFGKTDISCEGFRDRHDPYVLKGSCGLEYTLEYTDQGKAREHQKDGMSSLLGSVDKFRYRPCP